MMIAVLAAAAVGYAALDPTNVLLRVDGKELRKADVEAQLKVVDAHADASGKFMGRDKEQVKACLKKVVFDTFITHMLIEKAGGKEGILKESEITVDEALVSQCISNAAVYKVKAIAELKKVHAEATNVCKRARAGEDFAKLAAEFSADDGAETDATWGTFDENQLVGEGIDETVLKMKVGEVSDPVEADNGLLVLKLDRRDKDPSDPADVKYVISRIAFRLPLQLEEQTPDEIRADLRESARKRLFQERFEALKAKAKIEYPFGKNILDGEPQVQ